VRGAAILLYCLLLPLPRRCAGNAGPVARAQGILRVNNGDVRRVKWLTTIVRDDDGKRTAQVKWSRPKGGQSWC